MSSAVFMSEACPWAMLYLIAGNAPRNWALGKVPRFITALWYLVRSPWEKIPGSAPTSCSMEVAAASQLENIVRYRREFTSTRMTPFSGPLAAVQRGFERLPVEIGNCCYVGSQAVIAAGVKIGSCCVIGANSFVNDDVTDGTIAAGSTAKPVGRVVGSGENVRLEFYSGVGP